MRYDTFLLKYGEIGIKGKNRYVFEDALAKRCRYALRKCGDFEVGKERGRIYIYAQGEYDFDLVIETLQKIFGISWICPVSTFDDISPENVYARVCEHVESEYKDKNFTFKVESRRSDKHYPMNSMELSAKIGEKLLAAFPELKVDVHSPEVMVNVEIREKAYVYSKEYKGAGGMPVGTAGKGMLLLSGGIDSPVAGYMMAKRGVKIDAVYFHAPPYTSERAKEKVIDLAKIVSEYSGTIRLHIVNFTDIQMAIYDKCPHDELTIIMRRIMMRIAQTIAAECGDMGLITGESVGQVASQTMQSLNCTNAVCEIPVYRPLIAFDKNDIITISKKIGAFETSILPYEDCCTIFVAKHPVTKPILKKIEKSEKALDDVIEGLMKEALDSMEIVMCRN